MLANAGQESWRKSFEKTTDAREKDILRDPQRVAKSFIRSSLFYRIIGWFGIPQEKWAESRARTWIDCPAIITNYSRKFGTYTYYHHDGPVAYNVVSTSERRTGTCIEHEVEYYYVYSRKLYRGMSSKSFKYANEPPNGYPSYFNLGNEGIVIAESIKPETQLVKDFYQISKVFLGN